jgi:hypothetical protein
LFAKSIGARPAEIGPMLASVHARFVDPATTDEQRTRLLDLVVYFPKQANDRIVPELWKVAPAAFTTDQLTALAQYGPEPMTAELRNRAKREVLAAAYFGVRGDNCGEATLKATFRKLDVAHGVIAEPALGALGLAGLGNDKPLLGLQGALRDAAIAALDAGRLDAAKSAVLSAQWIDKLAHAPEKAELGWLADSLEWFALSRGAQLASADDVFKLIEELKT